MKILKKVSFFLQHPLLKMVWSKKFCTLDIFEEPINSLVTLDSFHGRESISVDFMIRYTVYAIYFASQIFRESGLQDIFASG